MFLKCNEVKTNGKSYKYYNIVESVRIDGKIKHNTLFSLGKLSDKKANLVREIIRASDSTDFAGKYWVLPRE